MLRYWSTECSVPRMARSAVREVAKHGAAPAEAWAWLTILKLDDDFLAHQGLEE